MKPLVEILLRGEESDQRLALAEFAVPAGSGGPPLHLHETWDEGFYVLEGEVTIRTGEAQRSFGPGEFAFAPRNTPHTFANLSKVDARILLILVPAGFEHYLLTGQRPLPDSHAVGPALAG